MSYLKEINENKIKQVTKDFALDTFLEIGNEIGADLAKSTITNTVGGFLIDATSSVIPGLSGAVQSYKRLRFEENMKEVARQLNLRSDQIQSNLDQMNSEHREKIDLLFHYVLDAAIDEQQNEKIEYMVNGFVRITEHESISEDFVLTYYDVLKELRLVDISVMRLMYTSHFVFNEEKRETYTDILSRHGITYEQYDAVRRNLLRIGLLTTKTNINVADDIGQITKTLKELISYVEKMSGKKSGRLPTLKEPKVKSKENFEVSKFGRDFVEFFLEKKDSEES